MPSFVLYEGLVVRMGVRFSFGISQFMEKMHMCLKLLFSPVTRYSGLVGTRALGEEKGPCLLYGYDFRFGFLCLLFSFASQWML